MSLLEAVELEEASSPIDFTCRTSYEKGEGVSGNESEEDDVLPSILSLRLLFYRRLPQWRAGVLDAIEEKAVQPQHQQVALKLYKRLGKRLTPLMLQLRNEFPGWCDHSEEVEAVALVSFFLSSMSQWRLFSCRLKNLAAGFVPWDGIVMIVTIAPGKVFQVLIDTSSKGSN